MSKTKIVYKDIAPGADRDATVTANRWHELADLSLVPFDSDEAPLASLEHGNWGLDGSFVGYEEGRMHFWSPDMSDSSCQYSMPSVVTLAFGSRYTSPGITVSFDQGNTYCPDINVKWYRGSTLLADVDYYPDAAEFYCQQTVENFDRIVISLYSSNLPGRYAKINFVVLGVIRSFGMDEITSASIVNQIGGCALQIPISTLEWGLLSRTDVSYMFQEKQPVEVYNDDRLLGVYYINTFKRSVEDAYQLSCQDAFGLLDESIFHGGVYSDYSAKQLVSDIVGSEFHLEFVANDVLLSGVIESGVSKRAALQQVLFAWGVAATTAGTKGITILVPGESGSTVPKERTYLGANSEMGSMTTMINVTAREYAPDSNGSIEIGGVKYAVTETVYTLENPKATGNIKEKVVSVSDATLVSPAIVADVAQKLLDYEEQRVTTTAQIVWDGEVLGDLITAPNAWGGTATGVLEKMEIALSNTVAAKLTLKGV